MKKTILFISTFLSLLNCKSQVSNSRILQALLNDSFFCRYVIRCKDCDTVHVVDTLDYFKNAPHLDSNIVITKEFIRGIRVPRSRADLLKWTCSNLFITKITRVKRRYRIEYFHTPTNGVGFIVFRWRAGRLIKVKSQFGQL